MERDQLFKINNCNSITNNNKPSPLWNQSSTSSSSPHNNNPKFLINSLNHNPTLPWHRLSLSRSCLCKSRWRRVSVWCATRSTRLRGGLKMRRASWRCWRGNRPTTTTGKCNVNLRNLSNLGDSPTHSTNSNRPCAIRWSTINSHPSNNNSSRWWVVPVLTLIRGARDKTDGYSNSSKIHRNTCCHLSTIISRSETHALRAR